MQNRFLTFDLGISWDKIPQIRRHFYVYALLAVGAVAGTNLKNAIAAPSAANEPAPAKKAEVLRLEGMQETTTSLYYR